MPKVIIFGAGIVGLAIATQLPAAFDIIIAARDLPKDSTENGTHDDDAAKIGTYDEDVARIVRAVEMDSWASPWACAGWVAMGSTDREKRMALDSLTYLLMLARDYPESSVRRATMTEVWERDAFRPRREVLSARPDIEWKETNEYGIETAYSECNLWYHKKVPSYRVLDATPVPPSPRTVRVGQQTAENENGKRVRETTEDAKDHTSKTKKVKIDPTATIINDDHPKVSLNDELDKQPEKNSNDKLDDEPDEPDEPDEQPEETSDDRSRQPTPPPTTPTTIVAAVSYTTAVITPSVFLPWLRRRLENIGVKFKRIDSVTSLADVEALAGPCDILINASGIASATLTDVTDTNIVVDRTHVLVVKSDYEGAFVRRAIGQYTYVFGRGDGTAAVGGFSEDRKDEPKKLEEIHKDLIKRAHENLPAWFPSDKLEDYEIVRPLVGIRPLRIPEVRVEKEVIAGQRVVHAYGTTYGGYIMGFGVARQAAKLVDEFVFDGLE